MARVVTQWFSSGLLFLFVVPLLVYGAYSIGDRWYQNYILTQQEEAIRTEIMRLREENLRLQRALNQARSDGGIETIAREQLGLVKPGDTAIHIVGPTAPPAAAAPDPQPAAAAEPGAPPSPGRPAWLRFLDGLFKR
jgi:cell division protein DivIC